MMTIITGPSLSGKSTLVKYLSRQGYVSVVMHTTRPMREGEKDGVDYYYISDEEFDRMEAEGRFVTNLHAHTTHGLYKFGLLADSLRDDGVIGIGSEAGQALDSGRLIRFVYLDISEDEVLKRAEGRGDDLKEVVNRFRRDKSAYDKLRGMADLILDATDTIENNGRSVMEFDRKG